MSEFNARNLLWKITHNWPLILAFFLVGSLLSGLLSLVWPASYRATTHIYVGLEPSRAVLDRYVDAYAQVEFRNPDDYKHWQMSQLAAVAFLEGLLQSTLEQLQAEDEYWKSVDIQELRQMLRAEWRNAGRWQLTANHPQAERARQAVQAWKQAILRTVDLAVENSRQMQTIDVQLRAVEFERLQVIEQQARLPEAQATIAEWRDLAVSRGQQPLAELERWQLQSLAANLDQPANEVEFPLPEAPSAEYLPWLDWLETAIAQEINFLAAERAALDEERGALLTAWDEHYQGGLGFSANLQVEDAETGPPITNRARSLGLAGAVGGILGLLAWFVYALAQISRELRI